MQNWWLLPQISLNIDWSLDIKLILCKQFENSKLVGPLTGMHTPSINVFSASHKLYLSIMLAPAIHFFFSDNGFYFHSERGTVTSSKTEELHSIVYTPKGWELYLWAPGRQVSDHIQHFLRAAASLFGMERWPSMVTAVWFSLALAE